MALGDLAMGIIFLSQTALGILGNAACLSYFIFTDFTGSRAKPTDLIVKHLTWANFMVLFFKGIPQTMAAFGLKYFLNDISCKLVFYLHRVARGASLGSTSLLSIYQAITISPNNSTWGQLKVRAPKITVLSLGLCWALNLLENAFIPMTVTDILAARNLTRFRDFVFCAIGELPSLIRTLSVLLLSSNDVMCMGLMMWASGSMVHILWKHRHTVQHIHSSLSPRSSPETRATKSILVLMSSFVLSYTISVFINMCVSLGDSTNTWLINANVAMSAFFPALCPFMLIGHYNIVSKLCSACPDKTVHVPSVITEL